MLYLDDIKVEFESQGFKGTHIGISPNKEEYIGSRDDVINIGYKPCKKCNP